MAALYAGVYRRLKDRQSPLVDKLKLTRFAWKSDRVYIPNKQQVLIDFLCGLLLNKKKNQLGEEDVSLVWKCLCGILHTKRVLVTEKHSQTLIVKPSICQVLIDGLSVTVNNFQVRNNFSHMIGCCHAIIRSPRLSYVFTTKYDNMVGLVSVLTQLAVKHLTEGIQCSKEFLDLLATSANIYRGAQRAQPNQKQVLQQVTDKLFVPVVTLWGLTREKDSCDLARSADVLHNVLEDGLFNSDHHVSYSMYLSIICGEGESKSQPPKVIENIFNTISNLLTQSNTSLGSPDMLRNQMLKYLPVLFKGFLTHKCADNITAHRLFLNICSLVGVKLNGGDPSGLSVETDVLRVITLLLQAIKECRVYSVAQDNNSGNQQLQTYKGVLSVVLNNARSSESFKCLQELLNMNHLILEPKLSFVLCFCCVNTKMDSDVVHEADKFLSQLISTYGKLRQVSKWVEKFTKTLNDTSLKLESFTWLKQFTDRFGEIIQALPQGSTAEILEKLIKQLQERVIPNVLLDPGDAVCCRKLTVMSLLVHEYLMNMRVADYSITEMTLNKVKDTMVAMQTNILKPLLEVCLQKKKKTDSLFATLLLCYAWGEVEIMLGEYTKHQASYRSSCQHEGVISLVHRYWKPGNWKKLENMLAISMDKRAVYVYDLLTQQTIRAVLLCPAMTEDERRSLVEKLLNNLLSSNQCSNILPDASWDYTIQGVTIENYPLAKCTLVTEFLPVVSVYLSDDTAGQVASLVVSCALCGGTQLSGEGMTSSELGRRVLEGQILTQNSRLQSAVISTVWTQLESALSRRTSRPKKKRTSGTINMASKVFLLLGDTAVYRSDTLDSAKLQHTLEVAKLCHEFMQVETELTISSAVLSQLSKLLQVLSALPLEFLCSVDRLRCIMGLTVLLQMITESKGRQMSEGDTLVKCTELLCTTLESGTKTPVFQVLNVEIYLEWLEKVYLMNQGSPAVSEKMLLLLELSCRYIVQDFQSLGSLSSYVEKMKKKYLDMLPEKTKTCITLDEKEATCLLTNALILHEVGQVVSKAYLKEDVRVTSVDLLTKLSSLTLIVLSRIVKSKSELPLSLINGYTTVVKHCSTGKVMSELKDDVMECFDVVLQWSIKVLSNKSADYRSYIEALQFLSVVCVYHEHLSDVFTQHHRTIVWDILMGLLSHIMSSGERKTLEPEVISDKNAKLSTSVTETKKSLIVESEEKSDSRVVYLEDGRNSDILKGDIVKGVREGDWKAVKRILLYNSSLDRHWSQIVFTLSQRVMAALIASCDVENFKSVISNMLKETSVECVYTGLGRLRSVLYAWQQLLKYDLSEEQGKVIVQAVKNLMSNCQFVIHELQYIEEDSLTPGVIVPVLMTQVRMLEYGQVLMSPQTALLALHSCQFAPLDGSTFVPAFHAVYEVLNALLVHHTNTVYGAIPAFLSCTKRLMKTVVVNSNQDILSKNPEETDKLIGCAVLFDRLCQLISTHRVDFGKVAVYMVADYVSLVQQVTILPAVKRALVPGIYKWLDLCDKYSIAQLHTVLNHGVKEVFKVLYADYDKYFRYRGKT